MQYYGGKAGLQASTKMFFSPKYQKCFHAFFQRYNCQVVSLISTKHAQNTTNLKNLYTISNTDFQVVLMSNLRNSHILNKGRTLISLKKKKGRLNPSEQHQTLLHQSNSKKYDLSFKGVKVASGTNLLDLMIFGR